MFGAPRRRIGAVGFIDLAHRVAVSFLIDHIGDFVDRALGRLPSRFRTATRLKSLMASIATEVQRHEDDAFALIADTGLQTADGDALDQWGALLGLQRLGLEDQQYRKMIRGQILANLSTGSVDDLIEVYQVITAPSKVREYDHYPKGYRLTAFRDSWMPPEEVRAVKRIMADARPVATSQTLSEAIPSPIRLSQSGSGFGNTLSRTL